MTYGPGYERMRQRAREEALEKLRQDTLRRQREALAEVPPAPPPRPTRREDEYPAPTPPRNRRRRK